MMRYYNYYKLGLSAICLAMILSAHSRALFGFGSSSDASISAFVPANSIDNTSVQLIQSAISLIEGSSLSNTTITATQNNIDPQSVLSYDILSAIQSSSDKSETLNQHIQALNQSVSTLTQSSQGYQSRITQSENLLDQCTTNKKSADANIIQAINGNNLSNLDQLLQASVQAGQCETQHKITINALTLVVNKLKSTILLLQNKISLIEQHESIILQYPQIIMDSKISAELNSLSSQF